MRWGIAKWNNIDKIIGGFYLYFDISPTNVNAPQ